MSTYVYMYFLGINFLKSRDFSNTLTSCIYSLSSSNFVSCLSSANLLFYFSLSSRRRSRCTALILEMKVQLSLRCWWGIPQLSEIRTMRYYCTPNQLQSISPPRYWFPYSLMSIFLSLRFFWLCLPSCPPRRAVTAPTWTGCVSLGQPSCRRAQRRRSGTEWKLCVASHILR